MFRNSSSLALKAYLILINMLPILLMIALIPIVEDDRVLTGLYALIIGLSLFFYSEKNDALFFVFGCCVMTIFEYIFISTGVETFVRNSLFGVMPLWLPFLWGYGFIAIRRANTILEQ